jgi:hypothetical protein
LGAGRGDKPGVFRTGILEKIKIEKEGESYQILILNI